MQAAVDFAAAFVCVHQIKTHVEIYINLMFS